jgi:hypothetical protein
MKTEGTFDAQANILWELLKKKDAASNFNFHEIKFDIYQVFVYDWVLLYYSSDISSLNIAKSNPQYKK